MGGQNVDVKSLGNFSVLTTVLITSSAIVQAIHSTFKIIFYHKQKCFDISGTRKYTSHKTYHSLQSPLKHPQTKCHIKMCHVNKTKYPHIMCLNKNQQLHSYIIKYDQRHRVLMSESI